MEFFNKLSQNETYKRIMKTPLSYGAGAMLLGIAATAHLVIFKKAWGVTGSITVWGAKLFNLVGIDTTKWAYFIAHKGLGKSIATPILKDGGSLRNIGIIVGATLATLYASEFKIKKIKGKKQLLGGIIGVFFMGFGARLAAGCNIAALFSALSALSLTGWFFAASLLIGAIIGSKILVGYIMNE
ncbi:YeeE/YedE thiosulfate transporter family protein [Pseudoleptotrichia goodfellowii]|jgi:membrane spanning protein|uniref:YeeE/YedE family protein n=1 Tax=Pseudoleptotrichia goodfellowii F0264 TaxID=596323 RepID=D0GM35_9FUSO|nr:YeeE/YedE thiosulfate transporter family protein [Pseudoleptotrichia goodfellowii]EEY34948.1 YeeE/YedE family protein [Pseudoleptotrichia goodfellowii F0264]